MSKEIVVDTEKARRFFEQFRFRILERFEEGGVEKVRMEVPDDFDPDNGDDDGD